MINDDNKESEIWLKFMNDEEYIPDISYAKRRFFNVPKQDILTSFSNNVIERSDELRFMPNILFNKYFHFFIDFIVNQKHDEFDADDIASCFTTLLNEKLDAKAIENNDLINKATNAVNFLHNNIGCYNVNPDIYGDLGIKVKLLKEKLSSYNIVH
jgi:hypothetical protein